VPDRPDLCGTTGERYCITIRTDRRFPYIVGIAVSYWRAAGAGALRARSPGGHSRQAELPTAAGLPGGARDVGGDDVGGVPVQAAASPVVPHRGPRVSVRGGLLDIAQRHAGIERGGDERVPQCVRSESFADPGSVRDAADDPPGAMPV
jgi:hypothetical protein